MSAPNMTRREFAKWLAKAGGAAALLPSAADAITPAQIGAVAGSRRRTAALVEKDSVKTSSTGTALIGASASRTYTGSKFTAGSNYTLQQVVLRMTKTGSPTYSMRVEIFDDSGGSPNAKIGTESGAIAASSLGASEQDVTFTGMSVSISNGTPFWVVVVRIAGGTGDFSNYAGWALSSGTVGSVKYITAPPGTWTVLGSAAAKFISYG